MIKGVIFDMDGVLLDSEDLIYDFEQEMFMMYGIVVPREVHLTLVGRTCEGFWSAIKEKYMLSNSVDEMIAESKKREIEMMGKANMMSGSEEFLQMLKTAGYKMILASSAPLQRVRLFVDKFKLDRFFSDVVSGDDVKHGKPDPEVFLIAAGKIGVEPANCVVIEDATNGVAAAKAAGMKCIGFNRAKGRQDLSAADLLADDFSKIDLRAL